MLQEGAAKIRSGEALRKEASGCRRRRCACEQVQGAVERRSKKALGKTLRGAQRRRGGKAHDAPISCPNEALRQGALGRRSKALQEASLEKALWGVA